MSKVELHNIRERLRKADLEPLTFTQFARSDITYLLSCLGMPLHRASFSAREVYYDEDGDPCLPLPAKDKSKLN